MTEFKKIFLDTSPVIYILGEDKPFKAKTQQIIFSFSEQIYAPKFVLSTITCEEYLVIPYRTNDQKAIDSLWHFVSDSKITVYDINMKIAVKAAQIRSKYKYFKTMDSLQLATACIHDCDLFLTNDKQLAQFDEINCMTIEEWQFED